MLKSFTCFLLSLAFLCTLPARGQDTPVQSFTPQGFSFSTDVTLPLAADSLYDVVTGDISAWWDHHVSEKPYAFHIEPYPGGAFMEVFDASGDGVRHAVVTAAWRGRLLRYEGPLGLAGAAFHMVTTYTFAPDSAGKGTRLQVQVNASGQMDEQTGTRVAGVWRHFLYDQLKPYVESGRFRDKFLK